MADTLRQYIRTLLERKIREVELSDGGTVKHGSKKHVKDLERRIGELKRWRDKERKASDARANYSRVIARLTQQLNAAKRSGLKEGVLSEMTMTYDVHHTAAIKKATNVEYFHISSNDLGEEFTFTPRLPRTPMYDDDEAPGPYPIEDMHTRRSSWASSIVDALRALAMDHLLVQGRGAYVYGIDKLPGEVDTYAEIDNCPHSPPDNDYDEWFSRSKYAKWLSKEFDENIKPTHPGIEDELDHCVPDARVTHEFWATGPVTARKIGEIVDGELVLI